MKQVLIQQGKIILDDIPTPFIEDGHVLVEVAYSLISAGTEVANLNQAKKPLLKQAFEQPEKVKKLFFHLKQNGIRRTFSKIQDKTISSMPLGYSCAGMVLQVGKGVTDIRVGDSVACAGSGLANHAEIVLAPRNLVVKTPEGCTIRNAASVTIGAIAMQGVRRATPQLGDVAAVIGLGLLGQLTVQILRANGCQVIGIDIDARRVALAQQNGAHYAFSAQQQNVGEEINHLTYNQGVDFTIITAASDSDAIVQQAMELTRKKGRVILVGAVGLGLKRSPFYEKEIDFLISCSYGPGRYDEKYERQGLDYPYAYVRWTENRNMAEYLRLIADGRIQLDQILKKEIPFEDAPVAFEMIQNSPEKPLSIVLAYPHQQPNQTKSLPTKITLRTFSLSEGKINVAVIGAGNFARAMHLPNIKALANQYHLTAIADVNGLNAKNAASQFGADYATTSFEDILADQNIHLVMICTRHHLHAPQTLAALQAGKHVFVEKPLAITVAELTQIEDFFHITANASKQLLLTGFNRRFSPFVQRIHEITRQRHDPMIINYRMNAGYIPLDNWVHTNQGGGRNMGEACHIYDLFTYLTQSKVTDVEAKSIQPKTGYYSQSDNFITTQRFLDGSIATLTYTALGAPEYPKEQMDVYVDGKVLVLGDYKKLSIYGSKIKGLENAIGDKGHLDELRALAKAIQGGGEWPIPLWQQVQAMKSSFAVDDNFRQDQ
jgi:predicted dehydrogenase/threonine dehydrogenase-like Zn-dependent dehydrogenase